MEQLLPGLFRRVSRLGGPHQPVNTYVWLRDGGAVVIDPAADFTPADVAALSGGGGEGVRIADIFITHLQAENAEGCAHFRRQGVPVHVPAGDEYLARGIDAYRKLLTKWSDPWEWETRGNYRGHIGGAPNERPSATPLNLGEPLAPGTTIRGLTVTATPGHGKHAVTLTAAIADKTVAFTGDLICADGRLWNWFDSEWDYGLHGGPRKLLDSLDVLDSLGADLLCPTHGQVIAKPQAAIGRLKARLEAVLAPDGESVPGPINFPEQDSPTGGWRKILPRLHQWRSGNAAVILSQTGEAALIDDGLCYWKPLDERCRHHDAVIADLKKSLGITRISLVIPTHFHGDHVENIPDLVRLERSEVVCLDALADVLEHPERFGLACPLPWYDTAYDTVKVDRRVTTGTRFRWHEYELEIFQLGGQTWYEQGTQVVIDSVRTVFVGDTYGGLSPVTEPVLCYNDCDPETRGWAFATGRLIERNPELIVCGHGITLRDPMSFLHAKRAAWARRIAQYRELSARATLREFFDPFMETKNPAMGMAGLRGL